MVDKFLIKDFLNSFRPGCRGCFVGWIVPHAGAYDTVMASTRIRCYDIIEYLNRFGVRGGLYKPFLRYGTVVFQKCFSRRDLDLAGKLKAAGARVIFDINVNYVSANAAATFLVSANQAKDAKEMLTIADKVIVGTQYLRQEYSQYHRDITVIADSIHDSFFLKNKIHKNSGDVKLLYCGYAVKAAELKLINGVLNDLRDEFSAEIILLCERDPKIDFVPYRYVRYDHRKLAQQLALGDIFIAPRDLRLEYNLGHAFTKVGYPMSVGIPVAASPVPSYLGSPALFCSSPQEWYAGLKNLINDPDERARLGAAGKEYALNNFSLSHVGREYLELFKNR